MKKLISILLLFIYFWCLSYSQNFGRDVSPPKFNSFIRHWEFSFGGGVNEIMTSKDWNVCAVEFNFVIANWCLDFSYGTKHSCPRDADAMRGYTFDFGYNLPLNDHLSITPILGYARVSDGYFSYGGYYLDVYSTCRTTYVYSGRRSTFNETDFQERFNYGVALSYSWKVNGCDNLIGKITWKSCVHSQSISLSFSINHKNKKYKCQQIENDKCYTNSRQLNNQTTHNTTTNNGYYTNIHTGKRGGKYYINSNGNKTYVRRGSGSTKYVRTYHSHSRRITF